MPQTKSVSAFVENATVAVTTDQGSLVENNDKTDYSKYF